MFRVSLVALTAAVVPLAACTANQAAGGSIPVVSTDSECRVSATEAPAGNIVFSVTNEGSQITEFYLLGADGLQVHGEVENIAPGISRDLVVTVPEGQYTTACKPGMTGDGIRSAFTVTPGAVDATAVSSDALAKATASYVAYVKDQTEQLLTGTKEFAEAFAAGDTERAKQLYAEVRLHWERIEPVAESFGDLDPRLDLREADLEPGQEWTGWHRAEKDLWPPDSDYPPMKPAARAALAEQLVADTQELYDRTRELELTPAQIGNGAKELLDEVATGKVTGEEEIWSHTDLWDFQANVDGARIAYKVLKPVVEVEDPALAEELDKRFAQLQELLDAQRVGDGFRYYDELSPAEIKELADAVNAVSEPLSRLTSVVVL